MIPKVRFGRTGLEVTRIALAESYRPPFDMAGLPRLTARIHETEDQMGGQA